MLSPSPASCSCNYIIITMLGRCKHPRQYDVPIAVIRRAKLAEDRPAKIFGVVIVERPAVEGRIAVFAMVGKRNGAIGRVPRAHLPVVGVGADRVDRALLQIVETLLDAFIDPGMRLHLDRDKILPVDRPAAGLRGGSGMLWRARRPGGHSRTE